MKICGGIKWKRANRVLRARARERSATRARASITGKTFLFHEQIEFSFRLWRDSKRIFLFTIDATTKFLLDCWRTGRLLFVVVFLSDDRRIRGRAWPRRIECWSAGRFNPRLRTSPWPSSASSTAAADPRRARTRVTDVPAVSALRCFSEHVQRPGSFIFCRG